MQSLYTKGPANVPKGFTNPTKSFTKHVWFAIIGLILFIGLYIILTVWFGRLAYNLFTAPESSFWDFILGIGFAFLSIFMLKSLFFLNKREENPLHKYLTQKDEPVLFDYLYKLADEAGAPRPHKIFLTDRVNASVSYDISLINLLFPSKKNLEIGLGAVNVLSLGELKAVLAHEFGHFAQRSMLLGRYVYVAQQIAARIVGKRDAFDSLLAGISSFDIRIAWIGWILSILVWAIRSLVESCFSVVMIAERALSREMEFQADLVAVSLTGSDALIHALYKLQIADEAYANAISVTNSQLGAQKAVKDLYVLQSNYIEKMRQILDDPTYGISPEVPSFNAASHRIFTKRKYNPPQMWATHPADNDRENNAKKTYIHAEIDNRSSWDLFSNPTQLREDMTASLIQTAKVKIEATNTDEESIAAQNKANFDWSFLAPKYHSAFYGRYSYTNFKKVEDLYIDLNPLSIEQTFSELYPKELAAQINQLKEIEEEKEALVVSQNEVVTAEKRLLYHRGEQIKRSDIPDILDDLKQQETKVRKDVMLHDQKCRTAHYKAAKSLGINWEFQLDNLNKILHYTEHTISNIEDCGGKFHNILVMALADGRITSSELSDIIAVATEYYHIIRRAYNQAETIRLDSNLLTKLNVLTFFELFEKFDFPPPMEDNINEWVNHVDSWANLARGALIQLRNIALEELLHTEEKIKDAYLNNKTLASPSDYKVTLVDDYPVLTPGMERPRKRKLDFWSRFFIGDGLFHSISKFTVSGAILFGALYFGTPSYETSMYVYNGLSIPINVAYEDGSVSISPNDYEEIDVNYGKDYWFKATTRDNKVIDSVQSDFSERSLHYVYNVANAGLLVQMPVYYGNNVPVAERDYAKTDKWVGTNADYIMRDAPSTISTTSSLNVITKHAFKAFSNINPMGIISTIDDEEQYEDIINAHILWDDTDGLHTMSWLSLANMTPNATEILNKRIENHPDDVMSLRALYEASDSIQKIAFAERFAKISSDIPNDPDYYYLATRSMEDEVQKNIAFIKGHERWKSHPWLAFASAYSYAEKEEWEKSYAAFKTVAETNKTLAETISLDAERVRRYMVHLPNSKVGNAPIIPSETVAYYTDLENGTLENVMTDSYYAYALLARGETLKAYNTSKNYEQQHPYVLRHIAVSKHATNQMIAEALALSTDEGINEITVWSAVGLAIRKGKPYDVYLDKMKNFVATTTVQDFITYTKARNFKNAEKVIENLDFRTKASFYTLGNIILKDQAPKAWKQKMVRLLYADERPYLYKKL
ncbi:M48 family metallopeptidase [Kordia jejudonensis]|uniref:M48 family metallopeptidase n=1 Tax=Kordia jejudonensis TaxID=1348245 RepID=UPI00069B976A|nr:M48 family metallopeptidase [Kordia jejudonensis]